MILTDIYWQKRLMLLHALILMSVSGLVSQQRVGIGTATPATTLNLIGPGAHPVIPGMTSTGIFRIAVAANEAIDIGKMIDSTFAGWIQSGYNGFVPDPLSLQPSGGNVGIGTVNPGNKLSVVGNANVTGNLGIGIASPVNKLSVQGNANISGSAGVGIITPNASAQLEVSSSTKGFLPPRMTVTQRNAVTAPAAGLMVWCSNCGIYGQIQVFNGVAWTDMVGGTAYSTPAIGDLDGGGIIAYILQPGDPGYISGQIHGLITTLSNMQSAGNYGCNTLDIPGASGTALGTGNQNTIDVVNGCSETFLAAKYCYDLVAGGYTDWYLPSKDELNKLYLNRNVIGGFIEGFYWSSSEINSLEAWYHDFWDGMQGSFNKGFTFEARAVRSF